MKKTFFCTVALITLSITACKKYPDGPTVSLISKTERVANNWKVAQAIDNGKDVTSSYNKYELTTTKSGGAELSAKFDIFGATFDYSTKGTWAFTNNNEKISFDFENDNADGVYRVLKLMSDEMWLKKDGGTLELHYVTR